MCKEEDTTSFTKITDLQSWSQPVESLRRSRQLAMVLPGYFQALSILFRQNV